MLGQMAKSDKLLWCRRRRRRRELTNLKEYKDSLNADVRTYAGKRKPRAQRPTGLQRCRARDVRLCAGRSARERQNIKARGTQPSQGGHYTKDMMLGNVRLSPLQYTKTQVRVAFMPGRRFPKTSDCCIAHLCLRKHHVISRPWDWVAGSFILAAWSLFLTVWSHEV